MVYRSLWESVLFQLQPVQALFDLNLMYFFGYPNYSFFPPVDFYPVLPWILLFFAGGYAGILLVKKQLPEWFCRPHSRPLVFCGQHTW